VLETLEVMRCVLLCILEAVKGAISLLESLEVPEVMRLCATLCAGGCGRWAVFVEVPMVMRRVLLCMLEAVDGGLCSWRCWRCRW